MGMKKWLLPQTDPSVEKALSAQCGESEYLCGLLLARGYDSPETIMSFLSADRQLEDPFALKDMDRAVERIRRAVEEGEMIAIYGDYDADGVTSTVVLFTYLESIGADVRYYIPTRDGEGYGLNKKAIDTIAKMGITLMITVDNGITAIEEISYANSLGVDVVVTDHHRPKEQLPEAYAVVDPYRPDDTTTFKGLAGVGVAFKLVCALEEDVESMLDYYAELVTIGTIADVMPMSGENRVIVCRGLEKFSQTENLGLQALMEVAGIAGRPITSETVAFGIVPRINATGRLGHAKKAVDLLTTDDEEFAAGLAQEIDMQNRERKALEEKILQDISHTLQRNPSLLYDRVLVLSGEGWHHGVVGIVAAKLVEKYGKPCFLISCEGGEGRGSGRSIGDFSLFDALCACDDLLERYGGHMQAAGLTVKTEKIGCFRERILEYAQNTEEYMPVAKLKIDSVLSPSQASLELIREQYRLEPFGNGNEVPVYGLMNCKLTGIYPVSNGKHLRLRLSDAHGSIYVMYFGMEQANFPYRMGDILDTAVTLSINEYHGEQRVSTVVKDMRLSALDEEGLFAPKQIYEKIRRKEPLKAEERELAIPTREDVAAVYRFVRSNGRFSYDYDILYSRMPHGRLNYCRTRLSADILGEMKLIQFQKDPCIAYLAPVQNPEKVDLSQSKVLQYVRERA